MAIPAVSRRHTRFALLLAFVVAIARGQSDSTLTGRVADAQNRPVGGAQVGLRNVATFDERSAVTNYEGIYVIPALPVGTYRMRVQAAGFRMYTVEELTTQVARTLTHDLRLQVGELWQEMTVTSEREPIDLATAAVGQVIDGRTVEEAPLNGRYFLDLAVLATGSVTASQAGFSTTPSRGLGALAVNTAGNREETVNYLINGVTLTNLTFSAIEYQPAISAVLEFKMDNSTVSAQYGQSMGAVVNVATRSGGNQFHGEVFEFLRNDALDARNYFNFTSSEPPPFHRDQFGGSLGGPIRRGKTFFFVSYEGLRQRQDLGLNSLVPSDAERNAVTDATAARLLAYIPRANFVDSGGASRFIGTSPGPVNNDQWGLDITHNLGANDRLHGYYSYNLSNMVEPSAAGATIPGFGHNYHGGRQFLSLQETHLFGGRTILEARVGYNRQIGASRPNAQFNPADFGIRNGVTEAIGLPQISVAGGALNFGGPQNYPTGRGDTTFVAAEALSCACGRHTVKIGGEYRQFLNNNFRKATGSFNFPTMASFLAGMANSFSVTLGTQSSSIAEGAVAAFAQDNFRWRPRLTIESGLRYEWNLTPQERYGRFIVFDPTSSTLERLEKEERIYRQNSRNFEPRLGLAWDPFGDGKSSVRAGYAIAVDQPMTSLVTSTAANPPLATPLTYSGAVPFASAIDLAQMAGLAPMSIDRGFRNAYLQSWNFTVQRELREKVAVTAGYVGSKGTHLILRRNINQPIGGLRPFRGVVMSSEILPGTPLGNITQVESTGNSSYQALWLSAARPVARGLQVDVSYTWSKSLDYNSLSSQGVVVQNSYDLRGDRGPSAYDARHRVTARAFFELPLRGNRLLERWQFAAILQAQSGNPVNIVTSNSMTTGIPNTVRPDVMGPIATIASVDRWFDISAVRAATGFGGLGRNVIVGPGFFNTDFAILKETAIGKVAAQFRFELFDVLNHANFGQPGSVVGSPAFGRVVNTRFPTGEAGSSRQAQIGVKLRF